MQQALNAVSTPIDKEGVKINPSRTTVTFTRRQKLGGIGPLKLDGETLQMSGKVRYYGIMVDSRLT